MKTLYLDLSMGAAGDMLNAALYELLVTNEQKAEYITTMNALGLDGVTVDLNKCTKQGITGTHMTVKVHGVEEGHHHDHGHDHDHEHERHHHHSSLKEIADMVMAMPVADNIKADVISIYKILAEAESAAHGVPVTEIHFHEVGTKDAIADITGVCLLMDKLAVDKVIASPVHVGSGHVRCTIAISFPSTGMRGRIPMPRPMLM